MIIDSHCHVLPPDFRERHRELAIRDATYAALFPGGPGRTADADTLLGDMDAAGIDHAVIMGFGWTDQSVAREANDYLVAAAAAHPDRLTALASVNPAWGGDAIVEARRCLENGARGVGELHADTQGYDLDDRTVMEPLMQLLWEAGAPVTAHASEPVGHHYPGKGSSVPEKLLRFATEFPENRIVLAHMGGGLPFYETMPEVAKALSNVWYDTAALPYLSDARAVAAAATAAGAEKILFGTDYPLLGHRRVLNYLQAANLAPDEFTMIMAANAASALGIPRHD